MVKAIELKLYGAFRPYFAAKAGVTAPIRERVAQAKMELAGTAYRKRDQRSHS
jgi:hypothetical protein